LAGRGRTEGVSKRADRRAVSGCRPVSGRVEGETPVGVGASRPLPAAEIVNAIFYQNRTGCQWAYLPHDLPPKSATYYYFALWRDDGTDQQIHDLLRCQARERAGRTEDPTAVVLDTQSIRAANHVPAATTGKDAAKKVPGRKRELAASGPGAPRRRGPPARARATPTANPARTRTPTARSTQTMSGGVGGSRRLRTGPRRGGLEGRAGRGTPWRRR
jgi:transposase